MDMTTRHACRVCHGAGETTERFYVGGADVFGFETLPCRVCFGEGRACPTCHTDCGDYETCAEVAAMRASLAFAHAAEE